MWKHDLIKVAKAFGLGGVASRYVINGYAKATPPRPRAFSLWSAAAIDPKRDDYVSDYTSWPSLVDRKFSGRHLGPAKRGYIQRLPFDAEYKPNENQIGDVTQLFARPDKRMKESRSSVLFAFFAQWFTDSLLRFDSFDRRRNTSNHDIDLCQIYGLRPETTEALRARDGTGRLKSQLVAGEEMLDYLCESDGNGGWRLRAAYRPQLPRCKDPDCKDPRFAEARSWPLGYDDKVIDEILGNGFPTDRRAKFYATGLERGNSSIGYVAISTIFMREHNRLAIELKKRNSTWDEERLFQTARNINIVLLMKLVVEDYINHILGAKLFRFETGRFEDETWYRPNWIAAEFDLLYRWHGLTPDSITIEDASLPGGKAVLTNFEYRNNNALLEQVGIAKVIDTASRARGRHRAPEHA